jgi:PKD repeat protein
MTATGTANIVFTAASLPAGLVLSGSMITGTPTTEGAFPVTLTATNAYGVDTRVLMIYPVALPNPNLNVVATDFNLTSLALSKNSAIVLKGTLPVAANFSGHGKTVVVKVGNDSKTFVLNSSGKSMSSDGKCSITWKKKGMLEQNAKFQCQFNGSGSTGSVVVEIKIDNVVFTANGSLK